MIAPSILAITKPRMRFFYLIPELKKGLDNKVSEEQILVRKFIQEPPFTAPVELRVYVETSIH